ncbi:DUF3515 domain-containing protein [Microbacterium sp. LRZ72]|uniref:DUF3515 family protein n=1 Tax=Microbacterium sp. LRZ72 TaxID=2942481 RepID=UPI0029A67A6C|nr:DUF3515 family protein [Microbacterium sp. LRZ72]MDX2375604.1 DUF3515 domain-containing protein [Microbacterium sp. LRZ72]
MPSLPRMLAAAVTLGTLLVTGCSTTVSMEPAPAANAPECADVTVRLPSEVAGQPRVWTNAQATASWGDPVAVVLACGVEPPAPTTLPCQTVGGVDWIIDDSEAPRYRLTTFGRTPAVELYLDNEIVSSLDVLDALSAAVARLPQDGECTAPVDTTETPAPTEG